MGSHKKRGNTFCGKPVCVGDVQCPKGAMTEAQKGLRERSPGITEIPQGCQSPAIRQKIGIPVEFQFKSSSNCVKFQKKFHKYKIPVSQMT